MAQSGEVVSVNISRQRGEMKRPVGEITIDMHGIVDDAHAGPWNRQVSMLAQERIDDFAKRAGRRVLPGELAENITVRGLELDRTAVLDRFYIGEAVLELSQIGKKCQGHNRAIFREADACIMSGDGIFCRVVQPGKIRPGDRVDYVSRPLRVLVVTLSDRAFAGQYEDRSGALSVELLERFFTGKRWHHRIQKALLPDDADTLSKTLGESIAQGVDVIFTIGSTGVGPRDIAPETVAGLGVKMLPGIMENIRIKYGAGNPFALLSRSIAAVTANTQLYTLPGSAAAVREYMEEIFKTLEHTLYMMHGLDAH
ncbi:MAG: molybdenum cofactor synthesis protein [Deltaproteobacteria bacterium]|nr:molybdenum cofactor synthesis protein [Deltaproteobacteria bacterium]